MGDNSAPCEASDLFRKLVKSCRDYRGYIEKPFLLGDSFVFRSECTYGSEISSPKTTGGKYSKRKKTWKQQFYGLFKFLSMTWWPERLCLADNLVDDSTRAFRRAWLIYLF